MKTKADNTDLPPILVRLQEFMDRMQLTTYQVNKEAGLCKGLLLNAYAKHQGLTTSTLEAVLNAYPSLNANWLICGRGEMLNAESTASVNSPTDVTQQHIADLDQIQQQAVTLIRTIQELKQRTQAEADARLLSSLL